MALANAVKGDTPDMDLIKQGMDDGIIKIWRAPAVSNVAAKVGEEIKRLLSEGFEPADIAVLSLRGRAADGGIMDHKMLAEKVVFRADSPSAATNIVVDSFLRFKGLERPAVIITDLHLVQSQMETRLHIALTRALDVVRIVGTRLDLQKIELLEKLQ
jgi:superfamily I DNA and RNA helicase